MTMTFEDESGTVSMSYTNSEPGYKLVCVEETHLGEPLGRFAFRPENDDRPVFVYDALYLEIDPFKGLRRHMIYSWHVEDAPAERLVHPSAAPPPDPPKFRPALDQR